MGKYLVKDLKKVSRQEPLNLKGDYLQRSSQKSATANLDLSSVQTEQVFTASSATPKAQHNLENITSSRPRPTIFYVPEERLSPPRQLSRFLGTLRFAALGLLIAFSINIFNVWNNGFQLRSTLIGNASSGVGDILNAAKAAQNHNFSAAETAFDQARQNFEQSLEKISFLNAAQNADLSLEKNSSSVSHFLKAGQSLAEAGKLFSQAADDFQNIPSLFIQSNKDFLQKQQADQQAGKPVQPTDADVQAKPSLTDRLKKDLDKVDMAITKLEQAQAELEQADPNLLLEKYRSELPGLRDKLANLNQFLESMRANFPAILNLLGDRYPHRYAILLQNDTEARPTGGFIGSLIILDVNDGNITRFDFHDVYQYDGQLLEKITPPEDIAKITDSWHLRDSNYSPDFALSAEKAAWFLQKSKGPSVDTVIAVNQSVMSDLLQVTGPIQVPELKAPLDENNFQFVLSYLIESKFYGKDQPKIILNKTIHAFQQKLLKLDNWGDFFKLLAHEIADQKIIFYSRDAEVQKFFEFLHLTPHQQNISDKEDFLQVVSSSVGGNKSDAFMSQELNHQTFIDADGTVTDELTIKRQHNWSLNDLEKWESIIKKFGFNDLSDGLMDLMGRGLNKVSLKIYLPLGTELLNVEGIDSSAVSLRSDAELQKTYLLFPMETAAGATSQVTLRYKLPYKLNLLPADIYRFTAQGQLGLVPTALKHELQPVPGLNVLRQTTPDNVTQLKGTFNYSAVLSS